MQRGGLDGARQAWSRGDSRGSAEATYALGRILELEGDREGFEAAMRRTDDRGSLLAAAVVEELAAEGSVALAQGRVGR